MFDRILGLFVDVRREERRALLWSFSYFFLILSAYYILRPLRDNAGITGGTRSLPWLFTATFFVMLAAAPLYGWVVARVPRRRLIPLLYHFFAANIFAFWLLLLLGIGRQIVSQIFFVWLTVFSLFAVSVFWSYLSDLYRSDQGKRLYGFIAAGGSLGALAGPLMTRQLVDVVGVVHLFLISALLLEGALFAARRLGSTSEGFNATPANPPAIGGNPFEGLMTVWRGPYLRGIAGWVALLSLGGTILYLLQAEVVSAATPDEAERTRIFATIDLWVGGLQILVQLVLTGRILKRFGTGVAVAFLPVIFAIGFAWLALVPALMAVMVVQAAQRTANFAVSNPAREVLFTAADREDKYKAKNVVDGVVFRGADMASGWLFTLLHAKLALSVPLIAAVMIPVSLAWAGLSIYLGRQQERRAKLQTEQAFLISTRTREMIAMSLSRRTLLAAALSLPGIALAQNAQPQAAPILKRRVPQTGYMLPVVGIGTAIIFDFQNDPAKLEDRKQVVRHLVAGGGSLIDTAAGYGNAEAMVGQVVQETGLREQAFIATKYSSSDTPEEAEAELRRSLQRLRTSYLDLQQAWNVVDANFSLAQLKEWKAAGHCRHIGITSSSDRAYDALAQVVRREKPEFFQINYSLGDRDAEKLLLPAAQDAGSAVLTNLPFGRNSLFKKVAGKPLPDFAKEIDCTSFAQLFLKYNLSHPAVTAVIPGTDLPQYMLDNLNAGRGRMPDAVLRRRIEQWFDTI